MEKHYFKPQEENDRFCAICDKYLTDEVHWRADKDGFRESMRGTLVKNVNP